MDTVFDFAPEYRDPSLLIGDDSVREVVHNECFSVDNMDDREVMESIVNDILMVTMWEKQTGEKTQFRFQELLMHLNGDQWDRVLGLMDNNEISGLISITEGVEGPELRIKDNHEILQASMDYCGIWYTGFIVPEGTSVIKAAEGMSLEEAEAEALSIVMDQMATVPAARTLQ